MTEPKNLRLEQLKLLTLIERSARAARECFTLADELHRQSRTPSIELAGGLGGVGPDPSRLNGSVPSQQAEIAQQAEIQRTMAMAELTNTCRAAFGLNDLMLEATGQKPQGDDGDGNDTPNGVVGG